MHRRTFLIGTAASAALLPRAHAQEAFPARAITILNAFPPGGANDLVTRPIATALEAVLKQPVVVETKSGAAGQVGAQFAANAKPDGYTLLIHITSISGFRASTLRVAYGTSKAALAHLTKQQAAELGALGIRVNAVAPGPVDTAMAKAVHTPAIRADYHNQIPLNRYGLETELAEAIFFLCSDRASYITGQTLAVDGGFESTGIGLKTMREEGRNG